MMESAIYGGRLKDKESLLSSSSGGAFTALSDFFLDHGDAVVASIYDYNENRLRFSMITDNELRNNARGSKYFQSNPENIYNDSKDWLLKNPNKKIMFVGTGCQADAFRAFMDSVGLRNKVFIVDLICYGVVSPQIWEEYLNYKLRNIRANKCINITFKDKRNGWKNPSSFIYTDGPEGGGEYSIGDYTRIYYSGMALRESCYKCPYTRIDRNTDITIGDFWGVDEKRIHFYSRNGNSLIIAHTEEGRRVFESVMPMMNVITCDENECMQPRLEEPTPCPMKRSLFWKRYRKRGIVGIVRRYGKVSFFRKSGERMVRVVKKYLHVGV